MAISMTVDEATTLFISIARDQGVDPAMLDREKIRAEFTRTFARRTTPPTPEQIAAAFAQRVTDSQPGDIADLDDLIARGEV